MKKANEIDPTAALYSPRMSLLVRLGSLIVHYQEAAGPNGHPLDQLAIQQLEKDPELIAWLDGMTKAGFLPVKR